MNLQFVKYFLLLADTQNFTRAAERAHVVQSTFSAGIKKLEESLDTRLFDRNKRNVSLTKSGEALLPKARQLMTLWTDIEDTFTPRQMLYLPLGLVQNLALDTAIPFISQFKTVYPLAEVHITEDKHDALLVMLEEEKIDVFFTEQQPIDSTKYQTIQVASEELVLAVNHQHPLARKEAVELNCLEGESFISRSHCTLYREVYEQLDKMNVQPKHVFTAHNNETAATLVSSGMGLTLMPKSTFSLPTVRFIPVSDAKFIRHIILVWKKEAENRTLKTFLRVAANSK